MAMRDQLAENTGMYFLPRPSYETVVTDDYTYVASPNNAWVLDIREPNVDWARTESQRRDIPLVEWWVGWSVRPSLADDLLSLGDEGRPVGFGRGIDMEDGVALMGGAVLPEARGRGVYRALVRARWDHAVARGTPLLVVQAGPMSAPVLDGLGFERHGEIRLFADRL